MCKSTCVFTLIATLSSVATAANFDPPDLSLELQMHRAFQRSTERSTTTDLEQGTVESYQLQKGESLWSLSQMLYGDGNYWPKVWSQNRSITNPHLVRQGHTLQLLLGSEDEAPAFRFSEEGEAGLELAAATTSGPAQIEIPPPEIPPRRVIGIPKSFPAWQDVFRRRPDDMKIDDSKLHALYSHVPDRIFLNGYVQNNEISPLGKFLEIEKESGLPTPLQYVYVKVKKGTGRIGMKLLVVKDHGLVKRLNEQVEENVTARYIEVFGDLELTDLAQSSFKRAKDRENFDVYRALILHANSLTTFDLDLIPGQIQIVDLSENGPSGSVNAQVIGAAKDKTSALYGPGEIVFLNRGSHDGVQVGQIMDVYMDRTIRDAGTPVAFSTVPSGKVKIVRTDVSCSTAVVLRSIDSILQGDKVQGHVGRAEPPTDEKEFKTEDFGPESTSPELNKPEIMNGSEDDFNVSE